MENKNAIYESGKLYGIYRCGKRKELLCKIPKMSMDDVPDTTGIILAGILNFGNDPAMIRLMAKEALQCTADKIKIPYEERTSARTRFIRDVITGRLTGTLPFSVEALMNTFYEFMDAPTEATKTQQAQEDIRDINRYLHCETRTPVLAGNPMVHVCNSNFSCQMDFMFTGYREIQTNKRKEGRRLVYDTETVYVAEAVRIFPGKPKVKESSAQMDAGITSRLELYIMLKAMEAWCQKQKPNGRVVLRSSYYYLQKDRESAEKYSKDFFDKKGGNVVSLTVWMDNMASVDAVYQPQLKLFLDGQSVDTEKCKDCASRFLCSYRDTAKPLTEEEKRKPDALPTLSTAQEQAATALNGNVRVIATAGSGKTTTMAYRILNLLKSGAKPEAIGCFTFTNAGAGEMADRIKGFCELAGIPDADETVAKMTISTLHSFGDTLLKKYYQELGFSKPPVLINEIQRTKIIESILAEHAPIEELYDKYKNFYMDMFKAKGILELMKGYFASLMDGMSAEKLQEETKLNDDSIQAIMSMYMDYTAYKKEACLIEHADQELGILKLLQAKPNLFDEIGLEHISVDEYQDTSNIQFAIIDAMRKAGCVKSLFIVGDDDQSIYGFRDANVKLIQDFFDMIGGKGYDIQLMENRRSTGNIVNFSADIIRNNTERVDKHPVSTNEMGVPVSVSAFENKEEEQEDIVETIERLLAEGHSTNDIAILAPTNAELLVFAEKLQDKGIPVVSINPEPILDNLHVRAAIAYVRFLLMHNTMDAMNYLNIKDAGTVADLDENLVREKVLELMENQKTVSSASALFNIFADLDKDAEDEIYQAFLEDVNTAKSDAIAHDNLAEICEYILDFERFGKKQTARREKAYDGVVLSTMHSSKGKEWPVVFCTVTKLQPRDMKAADVPEKNRLLFVACTRAKKELYISGLQMVPGWGNCKSDTENLFLQECLEARYGNQETSHIA